MTSSCSAATFFIQLFLLRCKEQSGSLLKSIPPLCVAKDDKDDNDDDDDNDEAKAEVSSVDDEEDEDEEDRSSSITIISEGRVPPHRGGSATSSSDGIMDGRIDL